MWNVARSCRRICHVRLLLTSDFASRARLYVLTGLKSCPTTMHWPIGNSNSRSCPSIHNPSPPGKNAVRSMGAGTAATPAGCGGSDASISSQSSRAIAVPLSFFIEQYWRTALRRMPNACPLIGTGPVNFLEARLRPTSGWRLLVHDASRLRNSVSSPSLAVARAAWPTRLSIYSKDEVAC